MRVAGLFSCFLQAQENISPQNNLALKRAYISRNSLSFKKAKMRLLSQHQSN